MYLSLDNLCISLLPFQVGGQDARAPGLQSLILQKFYGIIHEDGWHLKGELSQGYSVFEEGVVVVIEYHPVEISETTNRKTG